MPARICLPEETVIFWIIFNNIQINFKNFQGRIHLKSNATGYYGELRLKDSCHVNIVLSILVSLWKTEFHSDKKKSSHP